MYPFNSKTETYYKGKLINKEYFENNPDKFKDYPTQSEINAVLSSIRKKGKENIFYTLKISENGIEVSEKLL